MSKQEMKELPKGWVETKLGDIVSLVKGKKPKVFHEKDSINNIPYITIKAFEKNIIEKYTNNEDHCPTCEKR